MLIADEKKGAFKGPGDHMLAAPILAKASQPVAARKILEKVLAEAASTCHNAEEWA